MTALKKNFFAVQRAPRWGHVGPPCGARWTAPSRVGKIYKKNFFFNRTRKNTSKECLCETSIPPFNIPHIISSIKMSEVQLTTKN